MSDAIGVPEAMLGLPDFRVPAVDETPAEVVIRIETEPCLVGCAEGGVVAVAHDQMEVEYRDLAAFGWPARRRWSKRRWRCEESRCAAKTWTEPSPAYSPALPLRRRRRRRMLSPGRAQRSAREPDGRLSSGCAGAPSRSATWKLRSPRASPRSRQRCSGSLASSRSPPQPSDRPSG